MKKLFAIVLSLALVLSMIGAACAEQRTYIATGYMDAEGNVAEPETEADILVMVVDDEAMACAFGTQDNLVKGTLEIAAGDEGCLIFSLTLEDGTQLALTYDVENDYFLLINTDAEAMLLFENLETLNAEEPAA